MAISSQTAAVLGNSAFGAGAGMNMVGSYYAAQGQKMAAKYNAEMARLRARQAEMQARAALKRGEQVEQNVRQEGANLKSSQRATLAANGVDLANSDTAQAILASTDLLTEKDANTVRANTIAEAWGYRLEGVNAQSEAAVLQAQAKGINPGLAAASSLLTSAVGWRGMREAERQQMPARSSRSKSMFSSVKGY